MTSLFAACGEDEPVDSGPSGCEALRIEFDNLASNPDNRACRIDADCRVVGGVPSCDCDPHLSGFCSGRAVSVPIPGEIQEVLDEYQRIVGTPECGDFSGTCDCRPFEPECLDGLCQAVASDSCL